VEFTYPPRFRELTVRARGLGKRCERPTARLCRQVHFDRVREHRSDLQRLTLANAINERGPTMVMER
jgi:hypothetical protein